jgi:hypothetical protein
MRSKADQAESPSLLLWTQFSSEEQKDAVTCFWKSKASDNQKAVIAKMARILNFREKFVRERPIDWKVVELCKHLPHPGLLCHLHYILREFLIERRMDMICAILDSEGTPHKSGWIAKDTPPPTADIFVRGLVGVQDKFRPRDLLAYYFVNLDGGKHWEKLDEAWDRPEFQKLENAVFAAINEETPKVAPGGTDAAAESNEEFTTLDNLLIKSVVACATGIDGALSPDALEDLVQEVLTLGADRQRSYFHLGYLDAVLSKTLRGDFPGSNVSRRGWYMTGFLMGRLRSAQAEQIVGVVKEHAKRWEELMAEGPMNARVMLLPQLLPRFADAGEWQLLRGLVERAQLPADVRRARQCCGMMYEIAADLVRRGSVADALPLLESLLYHLHNQSAYLPKQFRDDISAATLRKMGQAHLRAGRFGEAKAHLAKSLENPDFPEAANARTDLGLAEARFRSLDFLLPKEDEKANESVIKALEKQIGHFEQSISAGGRSTNAHFVLGLVAFHRKKNQHAEDHLSRSLRGMLQKEAAYQTAHLVDWTRFLLALLIAEHCEPARLNEVRGYLEHAIASPAFFPLRLWERLCRNLSLYDDQSLAESAIQHVLKKRGDLGFGLLKESGLLTKNAALRTGYRQWLDSQRPTPSKKASELELLLQAAFKDGGTEEAMEILDALEGVAKTDEGCIPRFLTLLKERRNEILTIWDERDIDNTEAALLERTGRLSECVAVLQRLFYRYRADGDWLAIEDLLEQIEHLKVSDFDLSHLKAQVEHLRPAPCSEEQSASSLKGIGVLYVGGNETQERYEDSIREDLTKRHPGLKVTFYYPGWTSNWDVHLEKVQRMIPQHNVVVINNFVRTQFGRHLRALCGGKTPWRACTGRGRKSLTHSIELAATWVASGTLKGKSHEDS